MMNPAVAGAIVVLWRPGLFGTLDIARLLSVPEPDVVVLLDAVRAAERGEAGLLVVAGGRP